MKRSLLAAGAGIPLGRVLAPASRNDSPLLAPTLDKLRDLGPLPQQVTVHLDAGYDSSSGPNAWHNSFNRLQRCYELIKIATNKCLT